MTLRSIMTMRQAFLTSSSGLFPRMSLSPRTPAPKHSPSTKIFLPATKAVAIDKALMSPPYHHTLEQLMELAGLAVTHAVADMQPPASVCIVCGPGNNGGDGLVAARHLKQYGYETCILYPKPQHKYPFEGLIHQLNMLDVPTVSQIPEDCALVIDAIFGFSFHGENGVREPFKSTIEAINACRKPVVCIDVPSGWHVDNGPIWECCVKEPAAVVSLTAPKLCVKDFTGLHYIGGRFIPPKLSRELDFQIPEYEGTRDFVRIA